MVIDGNAYIGYGYFQNTVAGNPAKGYTTPLADNPDNHKRSQILGHPNNQNENFKLLGIKPGEIVRASPDNRSSTKANKDLSTERPGREEGKGNLIDMIV